MQCLYVLVRMYQVCTTLFCVVFTRLWLTIVYEFGVNAQPVNHAILYDQRFRRVYQDEKHGWRVEENITIYATVGL